MNHRCYPSQVPFFGIFSAKTGIYGISWHIALSRHSLLYNDQIQPDMFWSCRMDWFNSLLQAALEENPLVILSVVVLAFLYVIYRLGIRALTTIERISKAGGRR